MNLSASKSSARSREHGIIDAYSTRTVGLTPQIGRMLVREEEDLKYPLLASSVVPPTVTIDIENKAIGALVNGLGANWTPMFQGEEAFPEDDDEAGWAKVFDGMSFAGIKWVRFWTDPDNFIVDGQVKEHRIFRRLDRLQRWAAVADATIMLELGTVPPEFRFDDVYDAPSDNRRYVEQYIIPLLRHVILTRRCDRIRQLCLFNEPFNVDVTPPTFMPRPPIDPLTHYVDLYAILRKAMADADLGHIRLIGPNSAGIYQRHLELFEDRGLGEKVSATFDELDVHMWRTRFDYAPPSKRWPGFPMSEGIGRYLRASLAATRRLGKTLSLTESGVMYYNEDPRTGRVTCHDAFLCTAEQIVRAINEGVAGAMVWAYTNSGKIDGQWGWVGTRDNGFAPAEHLLNGYAVLMRHQKVGAQIRPCRVQPSDFSGFIAAGALVSPGEGQTIWLVNDHPTERIRINVRLPSGDSPPKQAMRWLCKDFSPRVRDMGTVPPGQTLSLVLPGMSLHALTSM